MCWRASMWVICTVYYKQYSQQLFKIRIQHKMNLIKTNLRWIQNTVLYCSVLYSVYCTFITGYNNTKDLCLATSVLYVTDPFNFWHGCPALYANNLSFFDMGAQLFTLTTYLFLTWCPAVHSNYWNSFISIFIGF